MGIYIGFTVIGILAFIILAIYNGLVGKKNSVENAFSAIDVQLKQRHDLIPNLVATVKNYMQHEQDTLETLTKLRTQALGATVSPEQRVQLENQISTLLSGVMVAVENYPELKANTLFTNLQCSLNEVEAQISAARRSFNAAVTEYNNAIEMFPSSIIAQFLGYVRKEVFASLEAERAVPDIGKLFS